MQSNNFSPLDIKRNFYAMTSDTNGEAEITMYGEIVESQPVDWWTGEPVPGEYIIQNEFLDDLQKIAGCKKLNIRMSSLGGDAGVSILIHNRLRELVQNGTEITCIVDGVAMSGGSLIMCACDHVKVNPSSLVMIHKCWGQIRGGYNADELRELAKTYDAWDNAQISIYKRKCGLSDTVISHMMKQTTYMTGKEALEKGFADELTEDTPVAIAVCADRTAIYANGHKLHMALGMSIPDNIPMVSVSEKENEINKQKPVNSGSNEGGIFMARNLNELRAENAELAATVESEVRAAMSDENADAVNHAVEAERTRISEIDEIACLYDDETVREAKYGTNCCTAQEMAFRAAAKAAKTGSTFMSNMRADYQKSGANGVSAVPGVVEEVKPKTANEQMNEARSVVADLLNSKKKGE